VEDGGASGGPCLLSTLGSTGVCHALERVLSPCHCVRVYHVCVWMCGAGPRRLFSADERLMEELEGLGLWDPGHDRDRARRVSRVGRHHDQNINQWVVLGLVIYVCVCVCLSFRS
jgi:hypothetical protein